MFLAQFHKFVRRLFLKRVARRLDGRGNKFLAFDGRLFGLGTAILRLLFLFHQRFHTRVTLTGSKFIECLKIRL